MVEKKRVNCDQSKEIVEWAQQNDADVFNKPINTNSLTSYVNKNPDCLNEIAGHVEVTDVYNFRVSKK